MKRALIFHGTQGSPEGNWFPWLQDELMMEGWQVAVPKLPTPEGQSLNNWINALEDQVPGYKNVDLAIGHSLGATFTLHLLERQLLKSSNIILVSALIDKIDNEEYDTLNKTFIEGEFDWKTIQKSGTDFTLIHGENDPYVPIEQPNLIADKLDIPLNILPNGAHINAESGFTQFDEILDFINV